MTNDTYAECQESLRAIGAALSASECHGLLCGLLCTGGEPEPGRWLGEVFGDRRDSSRPVTQCQARLLEIMQQTLEALSDPDCRFSPLLPDDDEPLAVRARALGLWCSGFLYGLGLGAPGWDSHLSPDAREILSDVSEFARISDDVEESGRQEADYAQLVEYLRVGVMLVHEEAGQVCGKFDGEPKQCT